MREKVDIFGIKFDNMTTGEIAERILKKIYDTADLEKPLTVFTPNPEIVMAAKKDRNLFTAMESADIISADGIGIVWASKFFGDKIKERASGCDIVQEVFSKASEKKGIRAFFYGGSEEAVAKAAEKMTDKYNGLTVTGVLNGYDSCNAAEIINESAPDLLLVGLGSPKQEKWVYENEALVKSKVIMVVGGSFDVMSGRLKRAPALFRKLGLEWLYRLIKQPKRLFRMVKLPLFVLAVLFRRGKSKT